MTGGEHLTLGQQHRSFDHVLQLPNVAWPMVLGQQAERLGAEPLLDGEQPGQHPAAGPDRPRAAEGARAPDRRGADQGGRDDLEDQAQEVVMLADPIVALATPPGAAALAVVRVSGDAGQNVAQVRQRLHAVPLARGDEAEQNCGRAPAVVGAGEQPVLSTDGDAAQGAY